MIALKHEKSSQSALSANLHIAFVQSTAQAFFTFFAVIILDCQVKVHFTVVTKR